MILSVSRRTDIPRFYFDWFCDRLNEGFVLVRNPMNPNQASRIELSKDTIDCIGFWTKDATPMIGKLDRIGDYPFFIQFTINCYDNDIETNLKPKKELVESFKSLSDSIGSDKMIWRYSPILLSDKYNFGLHLDRFYMLAKKLHGYTDNCRISFLDMYSKISNRMLSMGITDVNDKDKKMFVKELVDIGNKFGIEVTGCGNMDLQEVGLKTKACIDKEVVERTIGRPVIQKKDTGQRDTCYCMPSVDIGSYNTCLNGCVYCYANWSEDSIKRQVESFITNSDMLCDSIKGTEKIINRKCPNLR